MELAVSRQSAPELSFRLTRETLEQQNRQHDLILAVLTGFLAFLLASFPVLNADIWLQLRTGQMIVRGEFPFGEDPFCYPGPQLWVHTAWFWDVLVYGVYSLTGGPGLVLFRGVLVVVLAWVLFQIRRRDVSLFPVVVSLMLAFVAMSARLFLRSELISVLFLGITLWLLWHPPVQPRWAWAGKLLRWSADRLWLVLPVLFAVWANCDSWFFLGPVLVACFYLGNLLEGVFSEQRYLPGVLTPQERKSLLMLLGIALAACLLNPYTFRVLLQLPGDVASETLNLILLNQPGLRQSYLRPLLSPFSALYFQSPLRELVWWRPLGLSLAEWSFYPLAGLSLLSFVPVSRDLRWWRLLSWLVFFGLAAWQARNAAFFAVVAGPLMALNLQDWLAARQGRSPGWTKAGVLVGQLGRIGVLLTGVALCLLMTVRQSTATLQIAGRETALGMIHTRALGWSLGVDPSLHRSAMALAEWRLPGNGFSLDWREQPAYQAFFAPGLKSFLDTRLGLHGKYASDYFAILQALQETHPGRPDKRPTIHHYQWQDAFRKYDISYIIVSRSATVARPDPSEPGGVVYYPLVDLLLLDEIETQEPGGRRIRQKVWEMLDYVDGRTFILAWRGSPHFSRMEHLRFDAEREAFLQPRRVPPPNGPPGSEQMSPVAAWLAGEVDRPPTAGDEANWLLETSARTYAQAQRQAVLAALQTLTAVPTSAVPHSGVVSRLLLGMEPLSVAPQILAIRAARRAVAERPDSYLSWYRLFQAYADTYGQERELGAPSAVRETQLVCALREAVRLRPQEPLLHMELSLLYLRKGFGDLAVKHYEEAVRAAGRLGFSEEEFVERLKSRPDTAHLRPLLAVLPQEQQALVRRQASFNTRASLTSDPLERARIAAQLGLNEELRQALEMVVEQLQLKPLQTGSDMSLPQLLDLYLQIGYMPEALQLLARPDVPGRLGTGGYHQRAALARAALGDYTASIQHFLQFEEVIRRAAVERALLGTGLHTRGGQSEFPGSLIAGLEQLSEARSLNADRAEVYYQAGLVALEAGWVAPHAERPDAPLLLRTAILEIDPASPQANVARRYYRLVTHKWMEE